MFSVIDVILEINLNVNNVDILTEEVLTYSLLPGPRLTDKSLTPLVSDSLMMNY